MSLRNAPKRRRSLERKHGDREIASLDARWQCSAKYGLHAENTPSELPNDRWRLDLRFYRFVRQEMWTDGNSSHALDARLLFGKVGREAEEQLLSIAD